MDLEHYSFTFNPNKKGLRKILGDLETDIMKIIWAEGKVTVRQVHEALKADRNVAYTTVMTVMSRLVDKSLLERIKQGAAFVYRATSSKEEFTVSTVKRVVNELLEDFATPAISQFLETLENDAPEKIEELAKLIEQKRKE